MKTTSELQHLASRYGWAVGPLTYAKIQRMSSDEALFNERLNTAEYNRALNDSKVRAENKASAEASKVQRQWSGQATPEEHQATLEESRIFAHMFPQFRGDRVSNGTALVNWLRAQNLQITARNFVKAFQALGAEGKLILNPSAIGVGAESELTGHRLKNHPQLWRLLEPAKTVEDKEKQTLEKMSASAYHKAVLKPLAEKKLGEEIPGAALRAFDQAWLTFTSMHPEYNAQSEENREKLAEHLEDKKQDPTLSNLERAYAALVEAGELELNQDIAFSATGRLLSTGDSGNTSGLISNASSLSRKINSMSADEYSKWILVPTNRRAADAATNGSR